MSDHQRVVVEYLIAAFPGARVSAAGAAASPVFPVIDGAVERRLEISRQILDDASERAVEAMLRTNRIAETMRDQPGKRIVISRDRCAELVVEIGPLDGV
jgi:hypothetical protein